MNIFSRFSTRVLAIALCTSTILINNNATLAISQQQPQTKSSNLTNKQLIANQIDNIAKSGTEINEISRKTTLLIMSLDGQQKVNGIGSGSIIAKEGNTCIGVTNRHVVLSEDGKLKNLVVKPYDNEVYKIDEVKWFRNEDLAIVKFQCTKNYEPITLATYQLSPGQPVYLSGWPPSLNTVSRQFTSGSISTLLEQPQDGYSIGYTNVTQGGMSGGQVLDSAGHLVAIHGLGSIDRTTGQKTGFNYGIPVTTLLAKLSENGLNYPYQVTYSTPQESPTGGVIKSEPVSIKEEPVNINDVMNDADRIFNTIDRGAKVICGIFGC